MDSLVYEVINHNIYTDMGKIKDKFEYPTDNSTENMMIVGKL